MPDRDLIEDLIEIRAKLKRQLGLIDSGQLGADGKIVGGATEAIRARLKRWVAELNEFLKENAGADRS